LKIFDPNIEQSLYFRSPTSTKQKLSISKPSKFVKMWSLSLSGVALLIICCHLIRQALVIPEKFQHILRVLNTNIDGKQKIMFALTSIKVRTDNYFLM